ncbi:Hsp33 family molecular chaperone HslO [Chloroflexi bacterium TSY]|nr:Hsp33 family molecular chaperone HslO [Chloroflexi bacterium TSY]
MTKDYLVRVISNEVGIRGMACITTNLVHEASWRHRTSPTATVALGRALTSVSLLGAFLKVRQRMALKFSGDGPLGKIVVESNSSGGVRGYVANPLADPPKELAQFDVAAALGPGTLTVVKDLLRQDLSQGVVALVESDINSDLALYLSQSEQTPSVIETDVILDEWGMVSVAGGLLLQALPIDDPTLPQAKFIEEAAELLEDMPPINVQLKEGYGPSQVLSMFFGDVSYEVLEERSLSFTCACSRKRTEKALISLGTQELAYLVEDGEATVDCHFCHESYFFDQEELRGLLAELGK